MELTDRLALERAVRALRDAAFSDSLVMLDLEKLREVLRKDFETAGYLPNGEQCDTLVMGEETDQKLIAKDFPATDTYLNTFW